MTKYCYHGAASFTSRESVLVGSWSGARQIRLGLVCALAASALVLLLAILTPAQAGHDSIPASTIRQLEASRISNFSPNLQLASTNLTVSIVSLPWAPLGSKPAEGPMAFVVEAAVTNTGATTATDVIVSLNYQEDPVSNWVLLAGESPTRTIDSLAAGSAYHAYWFARYPTVSGASHQYTVTARATNANPVATSDNAYGNPSPGKTVQTKTFLGTGNSGAISSTADIAVGAAFTVTVQYNLGTNPRGSSFSPTGDPVYFNAEAYRLEATQVRFYNDVGTLLRTTDDRLYFPALDANASSAEVTYRFIAVTLASTQLCPYATVSYQTTDKYDQKYCQSTTVVPIAATLTLSLTKQANALAIQQGQMLTWTLRYTNAGSVSLSYGWIWDDVPPGLGTIIASSIQPSNYDPAETTNSRVAWYLGTVQPGASGTHTFALLVDGNGLDLADGSAAINHAFFGINRDSLPPASALTSTVTAIVQAPVITLGKTDGQTTAQAGDTLIYTLHITNSGSVAATGVVVTDVLPSDVTLAGSPAPPPTSQVGQTLVWNLGNIAANGGTVVITVPVTVGIRTPNGTVLANAMQVMYANEAGHVFGVKTTTDTTTVQAPVLSITKSDFPDPVLAGRLLTYTLRYTNSGPVAATNVVITDVVPLSTTYQTCSGGTTCNLSGGVVSWTIGDVPGNTSSSVSFPVLVGESLQTGAVIRNDAYGISADQASLISGPPVTTLVNRDAAIIDGYTFIDTNGNGFKDGGEGSLSSIAVTLPGANVPITSTDSAGYYRFRVEFQGPVSVTAELPPDYFRTTPGTVSLVGTLGQTQTVNFGYAPVTSTFGIVYGAVFADANHNGIQDIGENGLASATVSSDQAVTQAVNTNSLGQYTFRYAASGPVTITETNPAFYVSTTPDLVRTNAVTGSSGPSPIDFGDLIGIRVTGKVFDDVNVNGVKDVGEAGVSGATVTADGASEVTGASGTFTLYVTLADSGLVTIVETAPTGYLSTNAVPGSGTVRVNANTLRIDTPVSGTSTYTGDFGNVLASQVITISGQVWNDNGVCAGCVANGQLDSGELGLAGAIVSLNGGLSQTTGPDGVFALHAPAGQAITVSEANPTGYASTNAIPGANAAKLNNDTLLVSALPGGSASDGHRFGDILSSGVAVITGTVFNDQNQSGALDAGEPGLPGVTVTLEISDINTLAVLTGPDGRYQFAVAPGTSVRITSSGPDASFYATTPESMVAQPPAPGLYSNNNFGYSNNSGVAVISGIVFDDADGNGNLDLGEVGLAGAVITLTNGTTVSVMTSGNGLITGTFAFSVTQPGIYGLHQQNLPGYRSTTPDGINISVTLGSNYFVLFGDTNDNSRSSVYGVVFEDLNGNGRQDDNEPGLPGVVISLTASGGVMTTTTRAFGQYVPGFGFDVGQQGWHVVSEQDPAGPGYHSTTPDNVAVFIESNRSYIVNFGDVKSSAFGTIMGTVFDDQSGDGLQQITEGGIQDVLVSLSNGMTTRTGPYGLYTFAVPSAGLTSVTETDPAGYHSTTPNTVTMQIDLGQAYAVNFGDSNNSLAASVMGTVFNDQNGDGVQNSTEPGLSGVTVWLSGAPLPCITNAWGQYTFLIESAGVYTVAETDPPGYFSTTPNTVTLGVALGLSYQVDYGDAQTTSAFAAIYGTVFEDANGNGLQDANELGIQGVTITLDGSKTSITNIYGRYTLSTTVAGQHAVVETDPPGYYSTTPNSVNLGVTLGHGYPLNFGDNPPCPRDAYEEDDTAVQAKGLGSTIMAHNFCEDATDWTSFTAQANSVYTITTRAYGQRSDTVLALYGPDAVTLLAMNDDYTGVTDFSSRLVWRAPTSGVYYVQVTNRGGMTGRDTGYEVWKNERTYRFIYLPLVMRNYGPAATNLSTHSLLAPLGVITHTLPDAYEVDDTWQLAKPIVPGQGQIHTFDSPTSNYAPDKDYVRFRVFPGSVVTFSVPSAIGTAPVLELYGPTGDPYIERGHWITRSLVLTWTVPDRQYYFIAASDPGATVPATFTLRMEGFPLRELYLPIVMRGW
jgi:uncharacterized repeat protein (TIGR01451 family)